MCVMVCSCGCICLLFEFVVFVIVCCDYVVHVFVVAFCCLRCCIRNCYIRSEFVAHVFKPSKVCFFVIVGGAFCVWCMLCCCLHFHVCCRV